MLWRELVQLLPDHRVVPVGTPLVDGYAALDVRQAIEVNRVGEQVGVDSLDVFRESLALRHTECSEAACNKVEGRETAVLPHTQDVPVR